MLPVLAGDTGIRPGGVIRTTAPTTPTSPLAQQAAPITSPKPTLAPTAIISYKPPVTAAPNPVLGPINPAVPLGPSSSSPVYALPQPALPRAPNPTAPPISPVSGQPIGTSVLMTNQTPSTVGQQVNGVTNSEEYGPPQVTYQYVTPPTAQNGTAPAAQAPAMDSNTILILLLLAAFLVLVVSE